MLWLTAAPAGGQVSEPDERHRITPPARAFTAVDHGYFQACAVRTDAALVCWGDDYQGAATPPAGAFTAVSAGYHHAAR